MSTLPQLTETLDDRFVSTWYEIRPEAIDNILEANVVTAALKEMGCFTPETGGRIITRKIQHGKKTKQNVGRYSVLDHGEDEIETLAWWDWKYAATHAQRTMIDDQQNRGPSKIKDYVSTKLQAARDGMDEGLETDLLGAIDTTDGGTELRAPLDLYSLYNILPGSGYQTGSYTYGHIQKDQTWWQENYKTATANAEINLLVDMTNFRNTCGKNKSNPNLYLTTQTVHEIYEEFAVAKSQLIKDVTTSLANLGYEVLRFKGDPVIWSPNVTSGDMLFLNTRFIEIVYDPGLWFEMSPWRYVPHQAERIAYIFATFVLLCSQLRRQGLMSSIS